MTKSNTRGATERSSQPRGCAPSRRDEEYRRRVFDRLGLPDVAAISMALRHLTSTERRSSTTNAA